MNEDLQVIEKILSGKKAYFSILMEKYHHEIFKYVYNILGDYQTTEDLLQEIFLKVYQNLSKYSKAKASFRTWLYRIASNHTMNYLNSKDYKNHHSVVSYLDDLNKGNSDLEEEIIKDEKITLIKTLIKKLLKPKHQELMYLYYFSGLTVKEISETTNIPEKTIYKAIKTSVEKLKKEVALDE